MDNNVLLEIKDLRVSFPLDEGTVRAVEGVDLTIHRGEVLAADGAAAPGEVAGADLATAAVGADHTKAHDARILIGVESRRGEDQRSVLEIIIHDRHHR